MEHSFNFENAEENIIFDISDTNTAISKLASAKAPGPDKIPAEVYKALPHSWLQFLTDLFNIIIKAEYYPSSWFESIVKPIFKSGSTSDPNNYRGIDLPIECTR